MSWKRFLLTRATRWAACAVLVVGADYALNNYHYSRLQAQEKKEEKKSETKKTADELRKELEEKLKGIDLNDPKFDELTKEYEKKIKDAIGPTPPISVRGPLIVGPEIIRRRVFDDDMLRLVPQQGRFGIVIEPVPEALRDQFDLPADRGQLVKDVTPGSVAEKVGVKVNDIVLEFDGKPVPGNTQEFVNQVRGMKADVETSLVVIRKGKKETIKGIKLPEVKAELPVPIIDVIVGDRVLELPLGDLPNLGRPKPRIDDENTTGVFQAQSAKNGVKITISGTKTGKEKKVTSITIEEGDTKVELTEIDKVPEKYREDVQRMLKGVR